MTQEEEYYNYLTYKSDSYKDKVLNEQQIELLKVSSDSRYRENLKILLDGTSRLYELPDAFFNQIFKITKGDESMFYRYFFREKPYQIGADIQAPLEGYAKGYGKIYVINLIRKYKKGNFDQQSLEILEGGDDSSMVTTVLYENFFLKEKERIIKIINSDDVSAKEKLLAEMNENPCVKSMALGAMRCLEEKCVEDIAKDRLKEYSPELTKENGSRRRIEYKYKTFLKRHYQSVLTLVADSKLDKFKESLKDNLEYQKLFKEIKKLNYFSLEDSGKDEIFDYVFGGVETAAIKEVIAKDNEINKELVQSDCVDKGKIISIDSRVKQFMKSFLSDLDKDKEFKKLAVYYNLTGKALPKNIVINIDKEEQKKIISEDTFLSWCSDRDTKKEDEPNELDTFLINEAAPRRERWRAEDMVLDNELKRQREIKKEKEYEFRGRMY